MRGDEATDGLLVNSLAAPKCELRLVDAKKSLAIVSLETSSKKIAKHTLLAKWSENSTLSTRVEAGVAWSVQPKDLIFCKESESCMTLAKAFKEHYQAFGLVFGYVGFPVGSLPKELEQNPGGKPSRMDFSNKTFDDTRETIQQALSVARTAVGVNLVWMVKGDTAKKWVRPCGIAIVTSGQIILQASGTHRFSE